MLKKIISLTLPLIAANALACDCMPPEVDAANAKFVLQSAHYIVLGRIESADSKGNAKLRVLESFKGSSSGAVIQLTTTDNDCGRASFVVGEESLIKSFGGAITTCNQHVHPSRHLLNAFRSASKAPPSTQH